MAGNTKNINKKDFDFSLPEKTYEALNEFLKQIKGHQNEINLEFDKTIEKSKKFSDIQDQINQINEDINKKQIERNKLIKEEFDFTKKIEEKTSEIKKIEEEEAKIAESKVEKTRILKDLAFAQEAYTKNNNSHNKELVSNLNGQLKAINSKLKLLKDEDKINKDRKETLQYDLKHIEEEKRLFEDKIKIELDGLNESIELNNKKKQALGENLQKEKDSVLEQIKSNKLAENYSKIWGEQGAKAITKSISNVGSFYLQQEEAVTKISGAWGMTNNELASYRKNIFDIAPETTTLYGKTAKDLTSIQQSYSSIVGRNIQLGKDDLTAMSQISRILGSDEAASKFASQMERFGMSAKSSGNFVERIVNLAKKSGVNSVETLNHITENLKIASNYTFKGGLDQFAKMQIYSDKLRINMNQVAALSDKISTPEGAIETSAKLQVLGGQFAANADPMSMLYESLNDFEGLTERYQRMTSGLMKFNEKSGQAEFISPSERVRMKSGAEAMGLDFGEMVATAQTQEKRKKIESTPGFTRAKIDEATRENILSTAEWNEKSRAFQVMAGGKKVNVSDVWRLSKEDLDTLKPKEETIDNIAQNTLSIREKFDALFTGGMGRIAQLLEGFGMGGVRKTLDEINKNMLAHPLIQGFAGLLGSSNTTNILLTGANVLLTQILRATLMSGLGTKGGGALLKDFAEGGFGGVRRGISGRILGKMGGMGKIVGNISKIGGKAIPLLGGALGGFETYASAKSSGDEHAVGRGILSGALSGIGGLLGAAIPIPGLDLLASAGLSYGGKKLGDLLGNTIWGKQPDVQAQDAFISSQGSRIITPNGKVVATHRDDDIFALKRGVYNKNQGTLLNSMSALGVTPSAVKSPNVVPVPIGTNRVVVNEPSQNRNVSNGNMSAAPSDHNININMNGTIELKAGNQKIDLKELLNNIEFRKEIANLVTKEITTTDNGGRWKGGLNRYSIKH